MKHLKDLGSTASLTSNGGSYSDQAAIFNSNDISAPASGVGVAMRGMCLNWYDSGGGDFLRVLGESADGYLSPGDAQVFLRLAGSGENDSSFSNVFFSDALAVVPASQSAICSYSAESLDVLAACVGAARMKMPCRSNLRGIFVARSGSENYSA